MGRSFVLDVPILLCLFKYRSPIFALYRTLGAGSLRASGGQSMILAFHACGFALLRSFRCYNGHIPHHHEAKLTIPCIRQLVFALVVRARGTC